MIPPSLIQGPMNRSSGGSIQARGGTCSLLLPNAKMAFQPILLGESDRLSPRPRKHFANNYELVSKITLILGETGNTYLLTLHEYKWICIMYCSVGNAVCNVHIKCIYGM